MSNINPNTLSELKVTLAGMSILAISFNAISEAAEARVKLCIEKDELTDEDVDYVKSLVKDLVPAIKLLQADTLF